MNIKLLVVKNNITDINTLEKGVSLAITEAASIGLVLNVSYYDLKKQLTSIPFSNSTNQNGYYLDPLSFTGVWDIGYDVACCVFDPSKITPSPTNPYDNGQAMSIPTNWYTVYPQVLADYLLHELCHYFFALSTKPDITHYYNPAFSQKQRYEWYLYLLKDLIPKQMYKYFSQKEVDKWKLQPELWRALDQMRAIANEPFIITSGLRTPEQNTAVGGEPNSAHLRGLACDLAVKDNYARDKILRGIYGSNIPCFVEDAKNHIHVDIDLLIHDLGQTQWSNDN